MMNDWFKDIESEFVVQASFRSALASLVVWRSPSDWFIQAGNLDCAGKIASLRNDGSESDFAS